MSAKNVIDDDACAPSVSLAKSSSHLEASEEKLHSTAIPLDSDSAGEKAATAVPIGKTISAEMRWLSQLSDAIPHSRAFLEELSALMQAVREKDETTIRKIIEFRADDGSQDMLALAQSYIDGIQAGTERAVRRNELQGLSAELMCTTGCFCVKANVFQEYLLSAVDT